VGLGEPGILQFDQATIASLLIGGAGLMLTIAGFAVTLWQLRRTKNAADAARRAAQFAESRFANNHLLVLLPQLERIESDLQSAVQADNPDIVMHHLTAWRWQAGQLHALLAKGKTPDPDFMKALLQSVTLAADAKRAILESSGPVLKATRRVRDGIAVVTNSLGQLAIELSTASEEDSHDSRRS
jgi:hypothetical protein